MNNQPWGDEELEGLGLSWPEFHAQFPDRSYDGFRHKRKALRDGHAPTPKKVTHAERPTATDEELFETLLAYQQTLNTFALPIEHDVQIHTDEPIAICFPSDWHIGSAGCDLGRLRDDCRLIASHPRLYAALGGDPVDNFILDKMGSAARTQSAQVDMQWRIFRYLVKMLFDSNSLLWVSSGNHDAWTHKVAGIDGIMAAIRDIPTVYTGEGSLVRLTVGQQPYTIYRKHKPTRWRSSYNQTHFLKQMLMHGTPWEFDIGVSEHLHEAEINVIEWRPGTKMDRVLICCGSYKIRDQWAESLGYYGGGYGVPTVVLYPNRREMLAFNSIARALDALDGVSPSRRIS